MFRKMQMMTMPMMMMPMIRPVGGADSAMVTMPMMVMMTMIGLLVSGADSAPDWRLALS